MHVMVKHELYEGVEVGWVSSGVMAIVLILKKIFLG